MADVLLAAISLIVGWVASAYQAGKVRREADARHRAEQRLLEQMHAEARLQRGALHAILLQLETESGGRVHLHRDADGNIVGARVRHLEAGRGESGAT